MHLFEVADIPENIEEELLKNETLSDVENWLIDVCCQTAAAIKVNSSEKTQQHAEQIKAYIDNNLTKDIALSSISEYVKYSPTYVSKTFRQYYNISCIDYLNSCRVKLSQELLLADHSLSVKEIGFKVGFNNMQSFFRIFKRYTGMTPQQYREANRK